MSPPDARPLGPAQASARLPQIRVVDAVAVADGGALVPAEARLIEFTVAEFARLIPLLGAEGLEAFAAYLQVLSTEAGADGRPVLTVPDFSGAWVQAHTRLSRNAAYRAQRALEESGLMQRLVSRSGQGARGKQRAAFNPQLVLVPGGADGDISALRRKSSIPGSRKLGTRDNGAGAPGSQEAGTRENGPLPRVPTNREPGPAESEFAQVSAAMADPDASSSTGPTSSESLEVVKTLLSSDSQAGLISTVLVPAARRERPHLHERLLAIFNNGRLVDRLDPLQVPLRLDGGPLRRCEQFVDYLCSVLAGDLDPRTELRKLKVVGRPLLTDEELVERLVVALVVGLGMPKPVGQWGGWLHTATRPVWEPTAGNRLLEQFTSAVERLGSDRERRLATAGGARHSPAVVPSGPPVPATTDSDGVRTAVAVDEAEAPSTGEQGAGSALVDEAAIDEDVIAEHLEAALRANPMFASRADDPVWRSRLVRMYLADTERSSALAGDDATAARSA